MVLGECFEKFIARSPVSVMVRGTLARIIHEEVGRNGSPLLRSEAVKTFGPCAKERADGRVYYTTLAGFPSDRPADGSV